VFSCKICVLGLILILTFGLSHTPVAGAGTTFYLHIPQCTQDFSEPPDNLTLDSQEGLYEGSICPLEISTFDTYTWQAPVSTVDTSYPSGTWEAVLWLNTTGTLTQYDLSLGVTDEFEGYTETGSAISPVIASANPAPYTIQIPSTNLTLNAGSSLSLSLLNQDDQGNTTDPGFIFLNSASAPNRLTAPTSTTITQQPTSSTTTTTQSTTVTPEFTDNVKLLFALLTVICVITVFHEQKSHESRRGRKSN
jgi:hypothetical protein